MKKWIVFGVVVALGACDDTTVHILSGEQYNPARHCVEATAGFDVANGGSSANDCSPQCLTIGEGDAEAVYVTTMCPPFPGDYGVEAPDATTGAADPCAGAFAAYFEDGGLCAADAGGVTDAAPDAVGASDTGAGDAASDAGTAGD